MARSVGSSIDACHRFGASICAVSAADRYLNGRPDQRVWCGSSRYEKSSCEAYLPPHTRAQDPDLRDSGTVLQLEKGQKPQPGSNPCVRMLTDDASFSRKIGSIIDELGGNPSKEEACGQTPTGGRQAPIVRPVMELTDHSGRGRADGSGFP